MFLSLVRSLLDRVSKWNLFFSPELVVVVEKWDCKKSWSSTVSLLVTWVVFSRLW